MNYMFTLWLGSTNFPKTVQLFLKPRCQNSDINEVHNLKFRQCLGVVAQKVWKYLQNVCHITHNCKWISQFEMQSSHVFWRMYTLKSNTVIVGPITHDILSASKAYFSISLLSFMQKTMQKPLNRNIRDETLGNVPHIYNNLPTKQWSTQKHVYWKQQKTGSYSWPFLDIEGLSYSTSCDITKAAKWNGIGDTL
jgi:hypothetical protein